MIWRDVTLATLWATTRLGFGALSISLMIYAYNILFSEVIIGNGQIMGWGSASICVLVSILSGWIWSLYPALPMLFWRYRQHHVFRVVKNQSRSSYAIQLLVFGRWMFVDQRIEFRGVDLRFSGGNSEHIWASRTETAAKNTIGEIIEAIRPDNKSLTVIGPPLIFERHQRVETNKLEKLL